MDVEEKIKQTAHDICVSWKMKLFLLMLIVGGINHFALYANEITNSDGLTVGSFRVSYLWEVRVGRWGIYLIEKLRGFLVSPYVTTFLALIYMAISVLLILDILEIKKKSFQITVAILMIVSPAMAQTLSYYYCADIYLLACLLSCLAIWLAKRGKVIPFILGIVCIAFSLGMYQAYIGVVAGLALFVLILDLLNGKKILDVIKRFLWFACTAAFGLILYYILANVFLKVRGQTFAEYSGANASVLSGFAVWKESLYAMYQNFYHFLFGNDVYLLQNAYWHRNGIHAVIMILGIIALAVVILRRKYWKDILRLMLILVGICLIPFALELIRFITPERYIELLMSIPLYLIFPFMLKVVEMAVTGIDRNRAQSSLRGLAGVVLCLASIVMVNVMNWTYVLSDNATYLYMKTCRNQTLSIAERMLAKMDQLDGYKSDMPVLISGTVSEDNYPLNSPLRQMSVGQMSEWGMFWKDYYGMKSCWSALFGQYFGWNVTFCSDEDYERITQSQEYQEMGIFPDSDSVKIIDGIVVFKLTDDPVAAVTE